ncbi:MAG: TrkH family potassium uptake protein [Lachnospiraceae bacterium]|nr:TrkH family potassium uptake protein [Lachnospiraceae bacterium]
MNFSIIRYIMGWIIQVEGVFLMLPVIVACIYKEENGIYFLICAVAAVVLGALMTVKKPVKKSFYAREGYITVALGWIVLSLIGALPFWISGEIPHFIDALFEIISGFTTTGASILSDVEALSKCMLFWRSFSHWIGGMGVLVFVLAILPMTGGESLHFMKAESPGPSVSKLVPKLRQTAMMLYSIYTGLTLLEMVLLLIGKMPLFDVLCLSFGTAGTGGFGILNSSIADYTIYQQVVITIFMVLFGINFAFYFLILMRKVKDAFHIQEIRWYLGLYASVALLITINITWTSGGSVWINLKDAAFQAASVMTTTGYSTVNFDLWPSFSKTLLVLLMFIGACAGSTGGGIKVSRILIYLKTIKKELASLVHPRSVKILKMDGKKIEHGVLRSANVFLCTYILVFILSLILITLDENDLVTNFTAVTAALNNIGPGLSKVGPAENFGMFSDFSKLVLSFDMLAGRLELFPILLLCMPSTWKRK